ncbi:hypothetical protein ABN764_08610 [Paenibacillaceae sp. P-4]|uniref:hypothetical protein n=1 Tax=Paenibacillaceae bacterium P-4 TaxID=3160969 RepID=UPI0032E816C9
MGALSNKLKSRRQAKETLVRLVSNPVQTLIIHYSCESFYDIPDGKSPRITSIAVRFYGTGQTVSFSIHKAAELKGTTLSNIEQDYDLFEKDMLNEYFKFVKTHKDYFWVHWNMRDINYGFEAINHRFSVLKGKPEIIPDSHKIDLSKILQELYGSLYIGHPRLENILDFNGIHRKDFLTGKEEALAFENKEYVKLHQSTLRKVDVMQSLLERTAEDRLKTQSSFRDKYGYHPQGVFEAIKDSWVFMILNLVIGGIIGAIISKWFG